MSTSARLARTLRQHASAGWLRLHLSRTNGAGEQELPGNAAPSPEEVEALVKAAVAAGKQGFVKQTLFLAGDRKVVLDARHGGARVVEVTAEAIQKRMGNKDRAVRPDRDAPLLRALGIQNADGTISAQNAKKYKQVSHLVELLKPAWQAAMASRAVSAEAPLRVLDLACGNAYLSFVLAEALSVAGVPFRLHGVDVRADLVERCNERAATLGVEGLSFSVSTIAAAQGLLPTLGGAPDLVLALHACDTATDEALATAIGLGASALFVVPCCQAQLAVQLRANRAGPTPAFRHGLLLREYAATLTDALRVDALEACGYAVDVVEFVDAGHTPKNLLLRATLRGRRDADRLAALRVRANELGVQPALIETVCTP